MKQNPESPQHRPTSLSVDGVEFLDRDVEINCPRCENPLSIGVLNQEKIAGCPSCQGILVQTRVMASLVRFLRASYDGADVDVPHQPDKQTVPAACPCPACLNPMETHPYGGPGNVTIDSCVSCGLIWLDARELTQIIEAPGQRESIQGRFSIEEQIVASAQPIQPSANSNIALAASLSLLLGP